MAPDGPVAERMSKDPKGNLGVISDIANRVSPELAPGVVKGDNPDNLPLDAGRTFELPKPDGKSDR